LLGERRGDGKVGSLLLAGKPRWAGYLPSRYFVGTPRVERLGSYPLHRMEKVIDTLRDDRDLVIVRADKISIARSFQGDYFRVPEWVRCVLPVPDRLEDLKSLNHSVKDEFRQIRRWKLSWRFSTSEADLERFYKQYYTTYTRIRYGPEAYCRGLSFLRRRFAQGCIVWVESEGRQVAGAFVQKGGSKLSLWALGIHPDELHWLKQGAMAALYMGSINVAQIQGCKELDFRGTRPSLDDGLLKYKLKWGGRVAPFPEQLYEYLVGFSDQAEHLLRHTPLITTCGDGLLGFYSGQTRRPVPGVEGPVEWKNEPAKI